MKIIFLTFLIGVCVAGCQTTESTLVFDSVHAQRPVMKYPQAQEAYRIYLAVKTDNLTDEQKKDLAELDEALTHPLTDQDKEFIRQFPWIDLNHLSLRDKIFLMEITKTIVAGMMAVH